MTYLAVPGRILFLSTDPDRIDAQLAGANFSLVEARPANAKTSTSITRCLRGPYSVACASRPR